MNFFNNLFGKKAEAPRVFFCVVVVSYGRFQAGTMLDLSYDEISTFPDGVIEAFATVREQVARARRL